MTTIIQADRDAVNAFHSASFTAIFNDGGDKQAVGGNMNKAHTLLLEAFAAHREASEARAREEGAKAMRVRALECCEWPPEAPTNNEFARGMSVACAIVREAIAALDPAQIAAQEPKP